MLLDFQLNSASLMGKANLCAVLETAAYKMCTNLLN